MTRAFHRNDAEVAQNHTEYGALDIFEFTPPEWMRDALCAETDPELFYQTGGLNTEALKVCANCTVRQECLDFANTFEADGTTFGVWGGTYANERRELRREAS